jgi:hypothetical protein
MATRTSSGVPKQLFAVSQNSPPVVSSMPLPPRYFMLDANAPLQKTAREDPGAFSKRKEFVDRLYRVSRQHVDESGKSGMRRMSRAIASESESSDTEEDSIEHKIHRRIENVPGVKFILDMAEKSNVLGTCGKLEQVIVDAPSVLALQCMKSPLHNQEIEITDHVSVDEDETITRTIETSSNTRQFTYDNSTWDGDSFDGTGPLMASRIVEGFDDSTTISTNI